MLETIVDTVIELTDAERGFLLLKDAGGELQVKVARNIEQGSLDTPELALSRSIAKQAADRGEPVITVDAAGDDCFRQALSVTDLHLRSVLAVPLAVKGNVVGTIYVDHRLRKGVFDDEDVALVLDFAEQGAIAIENARLLAELRRRERQVDGLNRRLERDLQARHEELSDVRQELKESPGGGGPALRLPSDRGSHPADGRAVPPAGPGHRHPLPVLIQGESGTGKELVARAIHYSAPRRERPFVASTAPPSPRRCSRASCSATSAAPSPAPTRDSTGLFEVADGGTLFLDEIGELPLRAAGQAAARAAGARGSSRVGGDAHA